MRVTSGRAAAAALLLVGLAVLAVTARLLPPTPTPQRPATTTPAVRTAPGNTRGYAVPDALGRTIAQAERVMRTGGLRGSAFERDPQGSNAVVVAQEPPAGVLVPPGSVVAFRTRTDVQPYGTARRLRWCRPGNGMVRCQVRLGVPAEGVWTARIAKRSSPPAAVEVTVTFTPS